MDSVEEQTERMETLRDLMDRLCAPNLTLGESKALRNRLADLLGRDDRGSNPDRGGPSSPAPAPRRREAGWPRPGMIPPAPRFSAT